MIRSVKVRIFPTPEQETRIWKHIHACRFMWNYMLNLQNERQKSGEPFLRHYDMNYLLPVLKKQEGYEWLAEVSHASLQAICGDLNKAYKMFWKGLKRHPKFKSKKTARPCYPVRCTKGSFYFRDGFLQIEGLGKVKYSTNYLVPQGRDVKFHNPRIFYNYANGKWMVGFGLDYENQVVDLTDSAMGIDLGVKSLATVSFADSCLVFGSINKSAKIRRLKKKLNYIDHVIARKRNYYKKEHPHGELIKSKALLKYEQIRRELFYKISCIRTNYTHNITAQLVAMRPAAVVMEDLSVRDMQRNRSLSKAVGEQNFSMFIQQMQYKCEYWGISFLKADRYYPSSKICSKCGNVKSVLSLKERTYVCECCGEVIDRDYNAAKNLQRLAQAQ